VAASSFIPYKLRFFARFFLVFAALATFFSGSLRTFSPRPEHFLLLRKRLKMALDQAVKKESTLGRAIVKEKVFDIGSTAGPEPWIRSGSCLFPR